MTRFADISWEPGGGQRLPERRYCRTVRCSVFAGPSADCVVNPLFFAEMIASTGGFIYDRGQACFRRFDAGTATYAAVTREDINRLVTSRLIQIAHDLPDKLLPSDINRSMVRQVVWMMETQGSTEIPSDQQVVERFFDEAVER